MKTAVNYWMLGGFEGEVPVVEAAEQARRMGYDGIELCYGAGELTPACEDAALDEMRRFLESIDLPVVSLATGYYWSKSLTSPDEAEREDALAFTRSYIRAARRLGTDAVLIVPAVLALPWEAGAPLADLREADRLAREAVRKLLPLAEEEDVTLCIENVWNRYLTGPFELAAFIDSFDSPHVKAYFDVGNCLLFGYPEHWADILGRRIGRVHVKSFAVRNGAGTLDDFTKSLLEGNVNWGAVLAALGRAGFDGHLTAEMIVSDRGMPDLEHAARILGELTEFTGRHG